MHNLKRMLDSRSSRGLYCIAFAMVIGAGSVLLDAAACDYGEAEIVEGKGGR